MEENHLETGAAGAHSPSAMSQAHSMQTDEISETGGFNMKVARNKRSTNRKGAINDNSRGNHHNERQSSADNSLTDHLSRLLDTYMTMLGSGQRSNSKHGRHEEEQQLLLRQQQQQQQQNFDPDFMDTVVDVSGTLVMLPEGTMAPRVSRLLAALLHCSAKVAVLLNCELQQARRRPAENADPPEIMRSISNVSNLLEEADKDISALNSEIEQKTTDLEEVQSHMRRLMDTWDREGRIARRFVHEKQQMVNKQARQIRELTAQSRSAASELDNLRKHLKARSEDYASQEARMLEELVTKESTVKSQQREIDQLKKRVEHLESDLTEERKVCENAQKEHSNLVNQAEYLRLQLEEYKAIWESSSRRSSVLQIADDDDPIPCLGPTSTRSLSLPALMADVGEVDQSVATAKAAAAAAAATSMASPPHIPSLQDELAAIESTVNSMTGSIAIGANDSSCGDDDQAEVSDEQKETGNDDDKDSDDDDKDSDDDDDDKDSDESNHEKQHGVNSNSETAKSARNEAKTKASITTTSITEPETTHSTHTDAHSSDKKDQDKHTHIHKQEHSEAKKLHSPRDHSQIIGPSDPERAKLLCTVRDNLECVFKTSADLLERRHLSSTSVLDKVTGTACSLRVTSKGRVIAVLEDDGSSGSSKSRKPTAFDLSIRELRAIQLPYRTAGSSSSSSSSSSNNRVEDGDSAMVSVTMRCSVIVLCVNDTNTWLRVSCSERRSELVDALFKEYARATDGRELRVDQDELSHVLHSHGYAQCMCCDEFFPNREMALHTETCFLDDDTEVTDTEEEGDGGSRQRAISMPTARAKRNQPLARVQRAATTGAVHARKHLLQGRRNVGVDAKPDQPKWAQAFVRAFSRWSL